MSPEKGLEEDYSYTKDLHWVKKWKLLSTSGKKPVYDQIFINGRIRIGKRIAVGRGKTK